MKQANNSLTVGLLVGIFLVLNLLAGSWYFRIDLTEDGQYTLSKATKNLLRNIDDPVSVTAYFSEGLQPQFTKARDDVRDMLLEYNSISGNRLSYEFINPNEDEETEQGAMQSGVQPVLINSRESDEVVQKRAYMGLVLEQGDRREVIPFLAPGVSYEYELTKALKKVTVAEKPTVGFIQGHGEPDLQQYGQAIADMQALYEVVPATLQAGSQLYPDYQALVLMAPKEELPQEHRTLLADYLAAGGHLLVASSGAQANTQNMQITQAPPNGVGEFLGQYGVNLAPFLVTDARCGQVTVPQRMGPFTVNAQVAFPYFPNIQEFNTDHPITQGLETVVFQFSTPVMFSGDSSLRRTEIIKTSEQSGILSMPNFINVQKQWTEADFTAGPQTLALALEGNFGPGSTEEGRLVVFGAGDFAVGQQPSPDNTNLLINSVDWLSDDTGLISLRTKGATSRPIDELDDGTRQLLKLTNMLLPLLLVGVVAFVLQQRKRTRRLTRMAENYEE